MASSDKPQSSSSFSQRLNKRVRRDKAGDLAQQLYGKVPPQAPELEEAILGAVMIEKNAIIEVLDILQPESFYKDEHQEIYRAMVELFEASQPIDILTVTQKLRSNGRLEAVGGAYYISELTNRVVSSANLEYHARIVSEKYILRELIRISSNISRQAYEDTTDVFDLLDTAEKELFGVAEGTLRSSYQSMDALLAQAISQVEEVSAREEGLTGCPSGFTGLDRITSGWQPSDLVVIAARPAMGKTSFVLSLARNASVDFKKPVAFFSLEMSSLQLVTRLISAETEIDQQKLRNGQLEAHEWEQLRTRINKLNDAQVFIDDTAGLNVFELRAKCRRLKQQFDIQLVIIDYLQLMRSQQDNQKSTMNREQEISSISRALKGLAKELNIPVLALSQLSRAVETRGGLKKPILSDLRESGCLTGDTLMQDPQTGRRIPIRELACRQEQEPVRVMALDDAYRLSSRLASKVFYSGRKPVFELRLKSGRRIKASGNHPFLRFDGWQRLDALRPGDRLATPRKIRVENPSNPLSEDELVLLAHLIGHGCVLPQQTCHYTSQDEDNLKVVAETAARLFGIQARRVRRGNWSYLYLPSPDHLERGRIHPISEWYRRLQWPGACAGQKRLPEDLFACDEASIARFLHHLWAADGKLSATTLDGSKPSAAIYYTTSSEVLARQLQHLLLRLGILGSLQTHHQGAYAPTYHLHVQGKENQLRFLRNIGCHGKRGAVVPHLINCLETIEAGTKHDLLPKAGWPHAVKDTRLAADKSWRALPSEIDTAYSVSALFRSGWSQSPMESVATVSPQAELEGLAHSDLLWEEIQSIIPMGEEDVYDATVPGVHNFVANDIVVHNSIEQDADQVLFLYRPSYYGFTEDEEGRSTEGVTEVIIAKNRHGETANVRMAWINRFAKFDNLPESDDWGGMSSDAGTITRSSRINDDPSGNDAPF
jgi:replicative DNA helicase